MRWKNCQSCSSRVMFFIKSLRVSIVIKFLIIHSRILNRNKFKDICFLLVCKIQTVQSFLNFRYTHKQFPNQSGSVILNHYNNWALINSKVIVGKPFLSKIKRINEAIILPDSITKNIIEEA